MFNMKDGNDAIKSLNKHLSGFPTMSGYIDSGKNIGKWEITRFELGAATGYFSQMSDYGDGIALLKDGVVWMSITPMEIESHILPQHSAKGKVVIAGLGLGMITLSLLKKKSVKKLYVLEIDEDLIQEFHSILDESHQNLWHENIESGRLEVIQADCQKPFENSVLHKIKDADYAWVDIWENLGCYTSLPKAAFIQSQIKAKRIDYWGQELELIERLSRVTSGSDKGERKRSRFLDIINDFELPITPKVLSKKGQSFYFEVSMLAAINTVTGMRRQKAKKEPFAIISR